MCIYNTSKQKKPESRISVFVLDIDLWLVISFYEKSQRKESELKRLLN